MSGSDSSLDNVLQHLFKFKPHIYDISSFKLDHYKIQKEKRYHEYGNCIKATIFNNSYCYWCPWAFLSYEDYKGTRENPIFTNDEKKFLSNLFSNHNFFTRSFLKSSYIAEIFDGQDVGIIDIENNFRSAASHAGRVELPIPISVNAFEKQNYRPKSKLTKLNFESIYEPNLGFYASYCDLDILESFISIKPFEKKEVLERIKKIFDDLNKSTPSNIVVIHHCHSLAHLMTSHFENYCYQQQFFYIIIFNNEVSKMIGLEIGLA